MRPAAWCCFAAGLLLCGCGGPDISISGTVTLDSEPLADGTIRFIPIEGTAGPGAGDVIKDGKYHVVQTGLAAGRYQVSIGGYKQGGKLERDPLIGPPVKATVQIVPKQYRGENSELVREITQGANLVSFDLLTSGARK